MNEDNLLLLYQS